MTKKIIIFAVPILLFALSVLADTKNNSINLFTPEADSYATSIRNNFENLPTITDPTKHKIEGTEKIVEAQTQKKLTGEFHHELFYKYDNSTIIGKPDIKIKGPIINNNKKIHFWIITRNVQYYFIYTPNKKTEKRNEKFFHVIHFDNNKWKEDYLIVGEKIFIIDAEIQNAVALISEPLQKKKNETLYNKSIEKEKWTFNNREIHGKLVGYKNGKVHIQDGDKRPFQMDVTKFSLDDQILIRGYIDHLGIPVVESQNKK